MSNKSQKNDIESAFRKASPYLNIGYTLFGAIAIFGYLGYRLDLWSGKRPLFLLIGLFLGLFLGFYNMIKVIRQLDRE
jgi:F0F1-type ATP synthase assembly protein I